MATKWLTLSDTVRRLGVSESTVWRLLRRGALVSTKVRGRRQIAATSVYSVARGYRPTEDSQGLRPMALEDALFRLAGRFSSGGRGPGSSDKHLYLGSRR